ncbi:axial regulator YABBY 5-like [Salvia miltiorrhiza]|uniref:axial regulator YABBY 5-like n=1 Tax=Salvia miltiorrhiza TaxID=226208 RepID=UPI0025AC71AA|nr:axial regulator YABBY 5-like [Salvia miltiorrhiza]
MSTLHDLQEQICYVKCCFCNTILLVSVPCSSLAMVVRIRCGHCDNIFSLNMLHLFPSLHQMPDLEVCDEKVADEEEEDEGYVWCNQVIHKPPEKKQRAPTAYNHFIKYEIRRLKLQHPNITHKQAFSAAAKNWAHCPQSEYRDGEVYGCDEGDRDMVMQWTVDDEVIIGIY